MRDILIVRFQPADGGRGAEGHEWFNDDREADALKRYIEWQAEAMENGDQEVAMYRATVGDDDSFSSMDVDPWIAERGIDDLDDLTVVYRYTPIEEEDKPARWAGWTYINNTNHPDDNGHILQTTRVSGGKGEAVAVTFYHGDEDCKPVVQIDTEGYCDIRVNVNDGAIWDQSPEEKYRLTADLKRGN